MGVPEISSTQLTVSPDTALALEAGDRVQLVFVGEHDPREEVLWVQLVECLQQSTHRARGLTNPVLFHDLPAGETISFRPEHTSQVVMGGGTAVLA